MKEAEEFLLAHKDASTKCHTAMQSLSVKEHINTIAEDVVARLRAVVDELPTPDDVKKMQEFFFTNLQKIGKVLQLVPDGAGHSSGLTITAGPINAKAIAQDVQFQVRRFVQSSLGAVMSKAVRSVDEKDWTGLHESLVLSEKYLSGCERDPELLQLCRWQARTGERQNGTLAEPVGGDCRGNIQYH